MLTDIRGFRGMVGDALDILPGLRPDAYGACVTDPPYGLKFMGKLWDRGVPGEPYWREVLRILKPGGYLVAFGGTRTHHRLMVAIEDAGFEIRDTLMWLHGQGFPKSLDVSKAIDKMRKDDVTPVCRFLAAHMGTFRITDIVKALGFDGNGDHGVSAWFREDHVSPRCPSWGHWLALKALLNLDDEMDNEVWRLNGRKGQPGEAWSEREILGHNDRSAGWFTSQDGHTITAPATDAAQQWQGWGTALKPAWEPIILARKPLVGTVARNVLEHGTGALNVDGCRLETLAEMPGTTPPSSVNGQRTSMAGAMDRVPFDNSRSRWPANVVLSHEAGCREIPSLGGATRGTALGRMNDDAWHPKEQAIRRPSPTVAAWECVPDCAVRMLDRQSGIGKTHPPGPAASTNGSKYGRFGAQPAFDYGDTGGASRFFYCAKASKLERGPTNDHPTVKPVKLLRWLVRLVSVPGAPNLDPFLGSGSTFLACALEGVACTGIDVDPHAVRITHDRMADLYSGRSKLVTESI